LPIDPRPSDSEQRGEVAEAYYREGLQHQDEGRHAEAEASYRRSLALDPRQPKAHNNLGCVLQMQGRLDEAVTSFRAALALAPELAQANQNLAAITRDPAAADKAIAGYRRLLEADPLDAGLHNNLGNVYRELGRHREAAASFAEAVRLAPDFAEAHFSRGFELLLAGDYAPGFEEFEWRWKVRALGTPARAFAQPQWDGASVGTLLLHAEQGFGDTLHAIRYVPLAASRARRVLVECQPELHGLVRRVPGVAEVVAPGGALPHFDAHLPLMSLPRAFRTTLASVPWNGPYLEADAASAERWRPQQDGARLRVGLAWAGQPQQGDDRKRSLSLAALAPLAQVAGAVFYSLQKGDASMQARTPPAEMRIVELGSRFADFSDTAGALSHLDLVVTVDTSVAHLAGAMGVPTWVMLSTIPDWRYGGQGERTPWYPSMRLFRQRADGDWAGVAAEVAQALRTVKRPLR